MVTYLGFVGGGDVLGGFCCIGGGEPGVDGRTGGGLDKPVILWVGERQHGGAGARDRRVYERYGSGEGVVTVGHG